ncbi:hypothetical protein ACB094_01G363500 [Castanea mollissima]
MGIPSGMNISISHCNPRRCRSWLLKKTTATARLTGVIELLAPSREDSIFVAPLAKDRSKLDCGHKFGRTFHVVPDRLGTILEPGMSHNVTESVTAPSPDRHDFALGNHSLKKTVNGMRLFIHPLMNQCSGSNNPQTLYLGHDSLFVKWTIHIMLARQETKDHHIKT